MMPTGNEITIVFPDVSLAMERLYEAAKVSGQRELAALLGVRQSAISDARRCNRLPLSWLLELQRANGVSPLWVITGTDEKGASGISA